jgi:hypothetical protein
MQEKTCQVRKEKITTKRYETEKAAIKRYSTRE